MRSLDVIKTEKELLNKIISLGVPAVLRMGLQSVMVIIALLMVGHLGPEAIAAVGLGNRVLLIMIAVLMAVSIGVTVMVARYVGAEDQEMLQSSIKHAIIMGFIGGFFIAIGGWVFAPTILHGMLFLQTSPDPLLVELGTIYLRMALLPMIFGFLLFISNAIFQGAGDMKTPLYLMISVNIINISLMYLLVNGIGPFPTMGVGGAGLAQGLSRSIGGLFAFWILLRGNGHIKLAFKGIKTDILMVKKMLSIGLPASGENFVRQGSQVFYSVLIAYWGTTTLAANQIAMSIFSLSFLPGFGFAMAATALVGQSLGAGQAQKAITIGYLSSKIALIFAVFMGLIFFILGKHIAGLFTSDPKVINLTANCLKIIALTQPALAIVQILSGVLRGAGDTKWVLYITLIGNWGVRLVLALYLGFYLNLQLIGVWWAMAGDQFTRASITLHRFNNKHWLDVYSHQ